MNASNVKQKTIGLFFINQSLFEENQVLGARLVGRFVPKSFPCRQAKSQRRGVHADRRTLAVARPFAPVYSACGAWAASGRLHDSIPPTRSSAFVPPRCHLT